ncbi:MAG: amino acid permease [Chitinophagales bacterium]|nr:amino acid permease [Chitinophagales bacterium]
MSLFRKKSVTQVLDDASKGLTESEGASGLHRTLTARDLTAFGIAAVVGAGIFSTIGTASYNGGPGIILLFLFVAVACGFSALCYAEFASMVPVSGSAYTYSYVAFGEIIAWIIGWDLLMEYAIGNIAVGISWSDYFTTMCTGFGLHIPEFLTMDYWTAQAGFAEATQQLGISASVAALDAGLQAKYLAWIHAPQIAGIRIICDLPAFFILCVITSITYIGIKETRNSANIMVAIKMVVILMVIALGAFYVQPENWNPFLPNGISGVLKGTAAVFFAYIGFDAISTTAEECKDPQRDLPRGMIYSLIICTIVYVLIALVVTGMVKYDQLNVGDPLAFVFQQVNLDWIAGIVAISAVIATASVILVFQVGQPRIWMAMSRDGLLPAIFSKIHPRFKTPSFSTILTGVLTAVPALFLNLQEVIDLTSVGTLFAFVLVCGGILKLQNDPNRQSGKFKVPYVNSKFIMPLLLALTVALLFKYNMEGVSAYFSLDSADGIWNALRGKVPYAIFGFVFIAITIISFLKNLSLIPVLGFLSCSYLLCESGTSNWERFLIWLALGFVIYFIYGYRHSKLKNSELA